MGGEGNDTRDMSDAATGARHGAGAGGCLALVGAFGAGKTEVAANLAIDAAQAGRPARVADLDVLHPGLARPAAARRLAAHGVDVLGAGLPPCPSRLAATTTGTGRSGRLVVDVGGDDAGCAALARLVETVAVDDLWLVLNPLALFTRTVEGCATMRHAMEDGAGMAVTGLVLNVHRHGGTAPRDLLAGWHLARDVATALALPLRLVTLPGRLLHVATMARIDAPHLAFARRLGGASSEGRPAEPARIGRR